MKRALALSLCLLLPVLAAQPQKPGTVTTSLGTLPLETDNRDVQVALKAPAFAGVWVNGPGIVMAVTSDDPAEEKRVLDAVVSIVGRKGLEVNKGNSLDSVKFVKVKYNALQLAQVRYLVHKLRGWQEISVDVKANNVYVALSLPAYKTEAEALLKKQGIPLDMVNLVAPASPELPAKTTRKEPLRAVLVAPKKVNQGDILPFEMRVTNLGQKDLGLDIVCAFDYRILNAKTGEAVRPVPAPGACPSLAAFVTIKPRETKNALISPWDSGNALPAYWDLRDPFGKPVAPGQYILQLAHGRGDWAIRPADLTFEVLPTAPDGGIADVIKKLPNWHMPEEPLWQQEFVTVNGIQRLRVTVPDERAKKGYLALAKARGVSLARVDLKVLPTPPLPPAGSDAQATLKVAFMGSSRAPQQNFELKLAKASAEKTLPGARGCELVFMVRRVQTGELVSASSQTTFAPYRLSDGPQKCPTGATLTQHSYWRGRLSDGQPAPAGKYEVRAGLKVTTRSGKTVWLSAAPQAITLK